MTTVVPKAQGVSGVYLLWNEGPQGCTPDSGPPAPCPCRYTAVAMPMLYNTRYSSKRRVTVMIAIVWVLSFTISCPLLFGLNNTGEVCLSLPGAPPAPAQDPEGAEPLTQTRGRRPGSLPGQA